MYWNTVLGLALVLVGLVNGASQYVRCFERTTRRSIDNAQPIMEFFFVSPHQCLDQCVQASNNAVKIGLCRSFVYDHFQHSCRLYDHDGSKVPSIVHPAVGYDLYVRTATTQECAGPMLRFFRDSVSSRTNEHGFESFGASKVVKPVLQASTTKAPAKENSKDSFEKWDRSIERQRDIHLADDGLLDDDKPLRKVVEPKKTVKVPSQVFQPTEEDFELVSEDEATREDLARTTKSPHSSFEQPVEETTEKPETEISTSRPGLTAPPPGSPAREAIVNVLADKLGEILGTNKLLGAVTTQAPVTTEAPRPKQIVCPTSLGYYVVAGNELVLPRAPLPGEVHIFEGVGQPKCGQLCSTNRGPQGEHVQCASINYHHESQRCELYSVLAEPHGPGALLENNRVIYSEKFCLPAHIGKCLDDDIFILHAQKRVQGKIVGQFGAQSIAQCLQHCLNTNGCRSATFASSISQCILTADDVTANPSLLQPTDAGTVVVENGCHGHNRAVYMPHGFAGSSVIAPPPPPPALSPWSEWSECKYKVGGGQVVRLRSRSNGALQLQKC